jgi:predicted O-methyltransferase YrrM
MKLNVILPEGINGEVSQHEAIIIAKLAAMQRLSNGKYGGYALEIGTFRGSTTNNIAANFEGKVVTVDLPKHTKSKLDAGPCDIQYYGAEKVFLPDYVGQIQQIWMDSADIELKPGISFAFIDGCHTGQYVVNDFKKVEPNMIDGGYVLFHDYGGVWTEVANAINGTLVLEYPRHILTHVLGTTLLWCTICRL